MDEDSLFKIVSEHLGPGRLVSAQALAGGVSANVYRVAVVGPDKRQRSVVVRAHRPEHAGHDAQLEFQLMQALYRAGIPVPEPLALDLHGQLVGAPYVLMRFVAGSSDMDAGDFEIRLPTMAQALHDVHSMPTTGLPELPMRMDPLPEAFDFLPADSDYHFVADLLQGLDATHFDGQPVLLHGDFWPANLLWEEHRISAILDWEDAAVGDPLSDVACCALELRYLFGAAGERAFISAYEAADATGARLNERRLWLWQVYVAAAAQHFMAQWGLPAEREANMRSHALATIREAARRLSGK